MHTALIDVLTLCSFLGVAILLFRLTRQAAPGSDAPVKRLKVLQPTCKTCAHWSREEGQQVMDKFPAFRGAASAITPAEMGYGYDYDPETGDRLMLKGPKEAATFSWADFGACNVHAEVRHASDKCDAFEQKTEEA